MARLVGTITRNGSRHYVQYEPHNDSYFYALTPYLNVYLSPKKWAKALATGEAQLIGKGVAA